MEVRPSSVDVSAEAGATERMFPRGHLKQRNAQRIEPKLEILKHVQLVVQLVLVEGRARTADFWHTAATIKLPCPLRFVKTFKSLRFHLKSRINTGIILIEQKSGGKKISLR